MTKENQEQTIKIIKSTGSAFAKIASDIKNHKIRKLEKETLKNIKLAEDMAHELKTIQEISEIIWFGLIFVLLSQFMSFVAYAPVLAQSNVFIIQTISLFVVGISGAVLMIVFAPYLTVIPFNENEVNHKHSPVESLRKPLFLTGAITFSSWYFAFIVKSLPEYKFVVLLLIYISILTISAILALLWERKITRSL